MIHILNGIVTVMALVGVVLNIKKNQWCFFVWAFTNAYWTAENWHIGNYELAVLFATYFILAIWGIYAWRKSKKGVDK